MSEWQPIETAPKDGTKILVLRPKDQGYPPYCRIAVSFWAELSQEDANSDSGWGIVEEGWFDHEFDDGKEPGCQIICREDSNVPTHWMPLPAPPNT